MSQASYIVEQPSIKFKVVAISESMICLFPMDISDVTCTTVAELFRSATLSVKQTPLSNDEGPRPAVG
jgi:hypothetical protein